MTDQDQSLVDPDSKINAKDYIESPHDAFAKAHSPAGYLAGAGSLYFTEGVGQSRDDYSDLNGTELKGTGWLTGIPLADDTMAYVQALGQAKSALAEGLSRGKWHDGEALIAVVASGAGVTADALGAVDPAGTATSWAVTWLINHFRPFRMMIDGLTGIPEVIAGYATSWSNIEQYLGQVSEDFQRSFPNGPGQWSGDAHDGYLNMAATVAATLDAAVTGAGAMAVLIKAVGDLVAGVRSLIISLIATLVGLVVDAGLDLIGDEAQGDAGAEAKVAKVASDSAKAIESMAEVLSTITAVEGPLMTVANTIGTAAKDYGVGG